MKTCARCGEIKPESEFPYHPKTKDKLYKICKTCKGGGDNPWLRRRHIIRNGYLYLVQAENGLCKIGITDDVESRLQALQLQSPLKVYLLFFKYFDDANGLEIRLHRKFKEQHSHGEWFGLSAEQIDEIKEMK